MGSPKSRRREQNQLISVRDKGGEGVKNPKILRTSYLDCPYIVRPTAADLDLLLSTNDVEPPKQLEEMDEETQRQLAELDTGSVALVYETKGEGMCKHCASFPQS